MSRWCIARNQLPGFEAEDRNIVLAVQRNESVVAELQLSYGGRPRWVEDMAHSLLSKHVDDARPELGLARADCKKGLDRVVSEGGDLGVNAITAILYSDTGSANTVGMNFGDVSSYVVN